MNFTNLTQLIETYRYWILIPLTFIEGPIVAFVTGALSSLGYFNFFIAFAIFFFRDVILDGAFYVMGRWTGKTDFAKRFLTKVGVTQDSIQDIRLLWERHGFRTMFVSKLSYGLSAAFLFVAGIVEMPVKKFFTYAALVALSQYGVLLVAGYYFGGAFGTMSRLLENIQYAVTGIAVFITLYYIIRKFMSQKLIEEEKREIKS